MVWCDSFASDKIVFTLLTKVITLHIRPITVDIWSFGLKFVFKSILLDIEKRLNDLIQILLAIILVSARVLENEKSRSMRGSNRSFKRSFRGSKFI